MAGEAARALARAAERNDALVEQSYRDAPEGLRAEILDGVLCMAPRPRPKHQLVAYQLGLLLGSSFHRPPSGPGGWIFLPEPELVLGARPDRMQPDLAGWKRERLSVLPEAEVTLAPDWVCEVLSPSTEKLDRGTKMELYAQHGVAFVWLLDAEHQQIEVFANDAGVMRTKGAFRDSANVPPFDHVTLDLASVFVL